MKLELTATPSAFALDSERAAVRARSASRRPCLLLADCCAEPIGTDLPRTNHEASLLVIQALFGWVSSSTALTAALEGDARS